MRTDYSAERTTGPGVAETTGLPDPCGMKNEERLWFLDWLRVLAVVGVFLFHTLRPFDDGDWHVKNAEVSEPISITIAFFGLWGLAFFFLISGASAWLALRWRTGREFVRERLLRLLVPFVIAYTSGVYYIFRGKVRLSHESY